MTSPITKSVILERFPGILKYAFLSNYIVKQKQVIINKKTNKVIFNIKL